MPHNQPSRSIHSDSLSAPPCLPSLPELRETIVNLHPQNHSETQLEALVERIFAVATAKGGVLRIGMYDGSFDPPHYGHIETARAAVPHAGLDLVVMNCHPKPNSIKPNLSPHALRTKMLSSYLMGDPMTIVSPMSRAEIEKLLIPHRIIGIIGSDTLQRFLIEGIASDFNTDEIAVSERHTAPLTNAPETLEGRPVWYLGRARLAFNDTSSTEIRTSLNDAIGHITHPRLNTETAIIARAHRLYSESNTTVSTTTQLAEIDREVPPYTIPQRYEGCEIVQRLGLENGLLSESFIFEVRNRSREVIAFMKMITGARDPLNHLRDEAYGLALFNKLGLRTATAPHAHLCEDPPSLWIERAAGDTPGALLIKYEQGLISPLVVYDCLHAVGVTLKELHTRHAQPFDHKAAELLETYVAHYEYLLQRAGPHLSRNHILKQVVSVFREEGTHLRNNGVRCGFIHGDANTGNFLWDASTARLSVIDLQRLGTQARKGAPAFATNDYETFAHTLSFFPNIGFKGLRGGLEKAILAYRSGYGEVDPHEERFFRAMRYLRKAVGGHERRHEVTRPTNGSAGRGNT